jgi:hypothetical protein
MIGDLGVEALRTPAVGEGAIDESQINRSHQAFLFYESFISNLATGRSLVHWHIDSGSDYVAGEYFREAK